MLFSQPGPGMMAHAYPNHRVRLMNAAARADFSDRHACLLRTLVADGACAPMALPALHREVLPLVRANIESAGIAFDAVFFADGSTDGDVASAGDCLKAHVSRRARLRELGEAMSYAGIARAVLIKGAAISLLMPNPALRLMSDIDLLVADTDMDRAINALSNAGWQRVANSPNVMSHPSGWLLDLQVPATPLAEAIHREALPTPMPGLMIPRHEYHAALIAVHCFQGHGERVWRDVVDARLLRSMADWDAAHDARALGLATKSGHEIAIRAFAEFLAELDAMLADSEFAPSSSASERVELLRRMAGEQTSEVTLHLMRQLRRPRGARRAKAKPANRAHRAGRLSGAPPRGLYDLPRSRRVLLALRYLAAGITSRHVRAMLGLAALQHRVSARSLFSTTSAGEGGHAAKP